MSTEQPHNNGIARKLALMGLSVIAVVSIIAASVIHVATGASPEGLYVVAAGATGGLAGILDTRE